MSFSSKINPISYLKANAGNEETRETLALLKLLALGNKDVEAGNLTPAAETFARLKTQNQTG